MIWEVDEYSEERERRIRFFERRGGILIPRPYRQPPVKRRVSDPDVRL